MLVTELRAGELMRDRVSYDDAVVLTNTSCTCPRCGETKPASDFGLRRMSDGSIRNQSWCKVCRSRRPRRRWAD